MLLDQALPILQPVIVQTWDQIGHDILSCAEECGESISNEEAVESCIDADRLLLNGGSKQARDLTRLLIKEHGYDRVIRFLTRNIKLA